MNSNVSDSSPTPLPRHIAIIMDGNGRWAKQRKMPRTVGHTKGVQATRKTIEFCVQNNIEHLTLFAFSSENWKRPEAEVSTLMKLFISALKANLKDMHANGVRVRFIGDRRAFSESLQKAIAEAEKLTENNLGLGLNIAANYGGQWDIFQAAQQLASVSDKPPEQWHIDDLSAHLSLAGSPDPDLFIRTGGEQRISNFLLWQLAYAELYFSDVYWPDFNDNEMRQALAAFSARQRRFGLTAEQVINA